MRVTTIAITIATTMRMRGTIAAITTIIAADPTFDRMMLIDQATAPGQWSMAAYLAA
jgi:hypothetical protein